MIAGVYSAEDPGPDTVKAGEFQRAKATIRHWITRDGSSGFPAEAGRYHLYAAWNCPWAHRALLARVEKGLSDAISVSYARPRRTEDGWVFDDEGEYSDGLKGVSALHEAYAQDAEPYTGRITVPLLWDKVADRAVSNESADIVRMLNDAFEGPDLAPADLLDEIEAWNARIYRDVNNGVYRAGFARTQGAYDTAVAEVFAALDEIEAHLEGRDWLCGDRYTEADLRLFPTLARFDVAYHYAFKCNIRRLIDYPRLWDYARRIYHRPGVAGTVRFDIYKQGYFSPSELRNPLGIVPAGPEIDWT
jgi:putative glutathione S-transferase